MSQEARNTGRHIWQDNVRLRHLGIQFVSAGDMKPDDPKTLTENKDAKDANEPEKDHVKSSDREFQPQHQPPQDQSNPPEQKVRESSVLQEVNRDDDFFFYDFEGDKALKTAETPAPEIDPNPTQPESGESSEDEVVFAGRGRRERRPQVENTNRSAQSRQNPITPPKENGTTTTTSRSIEDPVSYEPVSEEPKVSKTISYRPRRVDPTLQRRLAEVAEEDELLADYIANMDNGDLDDDDDDDENSTDEVVEPSRPDRHTSDEREQRNLETSLGSESSMEHVTATHDIPAEIDRIFSVRRIKRSIQYLISGKDQGPDEARWVREELLTMPGAKDLIREFLEERDRTLASGPEVTEGVDEASLNREDLDPSDDDDNDEELLEEIEQRMTDEQLARALELQDIFGIDVGEDLVGLSDLDNLEELSDSEDDMQPVSKNSRRKARRNRKDKFPPASAFADAIDEDPYGAFDIMDFDRPSLKKKPKGRRQVPDFGLSDSDMAWELEESWNNDRKKKKAKKHEREELRAQGLLGNKNGVDMKAKYSRGMYFDNIKQELRSFLVSEKQRYLSALFYIY